MLKKQFDAQTKELKTQIQLFTSVDSSANKENSVDDEQSVLNLTEGDLAPIEPVAKLNRFEKAALPGAFSSPTLQSLCDATVFKSHIEVNSTSVLDALRQSRI